MKKRTWKRVVAGVLCTTAALTAMQFGRVPKVWAGELVQEEQMETFKTEADLDFHYTLSVDGKTEESTASAVQSWSVDESRRIEPEGDGTAWRIDFSKGNQKNVTARFDRGFDTVAHSFVPGTKTAFEVKFFYDKINQAVKLFGLGTNGSGAWAVGTELLTIKAQNESNRTWLIQDVNKNELLSLDDPRYQKEDGTRDDAKLRAAWENQWHHFYLEMETLADNNLQYDVWYNGEKLNREPIVFAISPDAVEQGATGINRFINRINTWSEDGFILIDDFGVQPLRRLTLRNSSVSDRQLGADPSARQIILDFNTPLDVATLETVTLKEEKTGQMPEGFRCYAAKTDGTRAVLEWTENLSQDTAYVLDYSGLRDAHSTGESGMLRFTTGRLPAEMKVAPFVKKCFDTQAEAENGVVENGVLHMNVNGTGVEMANQIDLGSEVHRFANSGDATALELKVKTSTTGGMRNMFSGADSGGLWWDAPVQHDRDAIQYAVLEQKYSTKRIGKFFANRWYHIFVVVRGNSYDFYVDGVKANSSPLPLVRSNSNEAKRVNEAGVKGIRLLKYGHKVWGKQESWWDDILVQKLAKLQLQSSSVQDGDVDVDIKCKTVTLDFNTLLDDLSIGSIKLLEGEKVVPGVQVRILPEDTTQAEVIIPEGVLLPGTTYTLQYTGLLDKFGTTAEGKLAFTTSTVPADAKLQEAIPAEGSTVGVTGFSPLFRFDQKLEPATVIPANVSVSIQEAAAPAPRIQKVELQADQRSVRVFLEGNLLAGKTYSLNFGEGIKTADGIHGIAPTERNYTFRTLNNPDSVVNELGSLASGIGGVYRTEGGLAIDRSAPENFMGDTERVILGNNKTGSIIFDLGGAGDYSFDFFDINYTSDGKAVIYVSESADGMNFTDPVKLVVRPQSVEEGFVPSSQERVPERIESFPPADGVNDLWRYSGKLQEGNRYLKLTMERSVEKDIWSWTPRIRNIALNQNTPGKTGGLQSSEPANGEKKANRTRTILLNFEAPLYQTSVGAQSFQVTAGGEPVDGVDVKLSHDCKTVTLTLPERMNSETVYMVTPSGVYNIYDQSITETVGFTTEKVDLTLTEAVLLNEEGKETEFGAGTFTPQFTLHNYTLQPQKAALAAAVYRGEVLEKIVTMEADIEYGEQVLKFTQPLVVEDAAGRSLKFFAWNSFEGLIPLPMEKMGKVDNAYFPGFVRKAVTLSYDDGPQNTDREMIRYMNQYGVRGTFNLNSGKIGGLTPENLSAYVVAYQGHELANHTKSHPKLNAVSFADAQAEIDLGKKEIEDAFGCTVRGFAYPYNRMYGSETELQVVEHLQQTGHAYGRPSTVNESFDIPVDFQDWKFTSHHSDRNFAQRQEEFYALPDDGKQKVFSVWGHSWEFTADASAGRPEATWDTILVPFLKGMRAHWNEIWNPTNIEFCDYIQAQRSLEIDQNSIYNPSETVTVYVKVDGQEVVIPPGARIYPN